MGAFIVHAVTAQLRGPVDSASANFPTESIGGTLSRHPQNCHKRNLTMLESWFDSNKPANSGSIERSAEVQLEVDRATSAFALYYYGSCWFCGTVRATIDHLNLNIELRDIHGKDGHHERLTREGGSGTVPCLLVERADGSAQWLYESRDISRYLEDQFGTGDAG